MSTTNPVDFYTDDVISYLCQSQLDMVEKLPLYTPPIVVENQYKATLVINENNTNPTSPPQLINSQPHTIIPDLHTIYTKYDPETGSKINYSVINGCEYVNTVNTILDVQPSTDSTILSLVDTHINSKQFNYLAAPITHPFLPQYSILTTDIYPDVIQYTLKTSLILAQQSTSTILNKPRNINPSTTHPNSHTKPTTLKIPPISPHPCITLAAQSHTIADNTFVKLTPPLLHAYLFAPHSTYIDQSIHQYGSSSGNYIPQYHPVKTMIFAEIGWASYLSVSQIILPPLPLAATFDEITNLVDTIKALQKTKHYEVYTRTKQMMGLYTEFLTWFNNISNTYTELAPSDPSNQLEPEQPIKYHFPARLFKIIYFPIALLYQELIMKNSQLSFSQLVPFSLPLPYQQSDSIAQFLSLILTLETTHNDSANVLIKNDGQNTSSPHLKSSISRHIDFTTSVDTSNGVIEPAPVEANFFINTHNPRFSATLIFSPLDYICACVPQKSQQNCTNGCEEDSGLISPLHFQLECSNPHVSSIIPSSYDFLPWYQTAENDNTLNNDNNNDTTTCTSKDQNVNSTHSDISTSTKFAAPNFEYTLTTMMKDMGISTNTHKNWFSRIFTPQSYQFQSQLASYWLGLNVKQIIFTPQCYYFNSLNVPILPKPLQQIVHLFCGQLGCSLYIVDDQYIPFYTAQPQKLSSLLLTEVKSPLGMKKPFTSSRNCNNDDDNDNKKKNYSTKKEQNSPFWPKKYQPPTHTNYGSEQPIYPLINDHMLDTILSKTLFYNSDLTQGSELRYNNFLGFLSLSTRHHIHSPPLITYEAKFCAPFRDQLQIPLQPLGNQLENSTYEVFEKDPVKYRNYRLAIEQMLLQMNSQLMADIENKTHTNAPVFKICILGAGRGPLVQCCIEASHNTKIAIELTAIEKNPFAFCSLLERVNSSGGWGNGNCIDEYCDDDCELLDGGDDNDDDDNNDNLDVNRSCSCLPVDRVNWAHVNIIHQDMREIIHKNKELLSDKNTNNKNPPQSGNENPLLFNIVVSELLGSFGDNELSPECLFGVEWLLTRQSVNNVYKPINPVLNIQGFSIPHQSRSYIAPVMATNVYNNIIGHNIGTAMIETKYGKDTSSSNSSNQSNLKTPQTESISVDNFSTTIPYDENINIVKTNKLLHTPYVTALHNHHILSRPQEVFQFFHPDKTPIPPPHTHPTVYSLPVQQQDTTSTQASIQSTQPTHNNTHLDHTLCRYTRLQFKLDKFVTKATVEGHHDHDIVINTDAVIHGFAGYFDSILFDPHHITKTSSKHHKESDQKDYNHDDDGKSPSKVDSSSSDNKTHYSNPIGISILPETYSHGMFSWFPLFFPLQIPILQSTLPIDEDGNSIIFIEMWRKCDSKRVWYEYSVIGQGIIHNLDGLAYSIGLAPG